MDNSRVSVFKCNSARIKWLNKFVNISRKNQRCPGTFVKQYKATSLHFSSRRHRMAVLTRKCETKSSIVQNNTVQHSTV